MRVALVHDWLVGMRGGERCLEVMLEFFPGADVFTLFHNPDSMSELLKKQNIVASCLNRLPGVKRYYRHLLPFYSIGVRDLERKIAKGNYDLVLSISHCVAKNVQTEPGVFHLCYCLTPVRYLWDQYEVYFGGKRMEPLIRMIAKRMRDWDVITAQRVHRFVGISKFVRTRIGRCWGRDADVVYPPVRADWIRPRAEDDLGEGFLCANALVPYKNVDLVIRTFNQLKLPLTVVGSGPEEKKLRALAGPTIVFRQNIGDAELAELYQKSKALVFAGEEDFGIIPLEMQAAGRPVICYGKGGVLETVTASGNSPTGIYFSELTTASLSAAINDFMVRQAEFTVDNCVSQAQKFSLDCFRNQFAAVLRAAGLSFTPPGFTSLGSADLLMPRAEQANESELDTVRRSSVTGIM